MSVLARLDDADRRLGLARRPEIVFLLIGLLAVGAGATRIVRAGDDGPDAAERVDDPGIEREGEAETVRVGPPDGVPVDEYVATRRDTLAALADAEPNAGTIGIASFRTYLAPDEVVAVLGAHGVDVRAARYLLGGEGFAELDDQLRGRTVLADDPRGALVDALEGAAAEARATADELDGLAATTDDPEFVAVYEEDRDRFAAAADAVGPDGCPCVYAVEVIGSLAALRDLGAHPDVRLVDVAPPGPPEQRVILEGLLPGS